MSSLADTFDITRDTVCSARQQATEALAQYFERAPFGVVELAVTPPLVDRTIIALRVIVPNSIRAIERLLPLLYPGVSASHGYIQGVLVQGEERAAKFNESDDLSGLDALAVDEMFSQGKPVLAGVDLDFVFLAELELRESRSTDN